MISSFQDILAMGYGGYAVINGTPIPLLGASANEEDNLILSSGPIATSSNLAAGVVASKDRRALRISLNIPLSPAILHLIPDLSYGTWRSSSSIGLSSATSIIVHKGSGEGYNAQAYVDSVSLSVSQNSLVTLSISATSWVWEDMSSISPIPRFVRGLDPSSSGYKPIPNWLALISTDILSNQSVLTDWDLNLNNNWEFEHLLEATFEPSNPPQVYPGPLEGDLGLKWLATRNERPLEAGSAIITLNDPNPGSHPTLLTISIPKLVRESRTTSGLGVPNDPLLWEASYSLTRISPL